MCKFHASGREDMDVRMLLRPSSQGRPFCVQFIDSLRPILSEDQLQQLVDTINHTNKDDKDDDNNKSSSALWYGKNPLGVGISKEFRLVPAKAFSSLQADTETKVKHYGCHCWSERELPADVEDLTPIFFANVTFPLTIQQKTPLRVLHRRANAVRERQILQAKATRIDDHHFRFELSTQAGTYVKEFVHGDLCRTKPSVASIIGCKTNLLILDCEGIDVEEEESQVKDDAVPGK
jgi:tRNA pseudouridine synthase 10